MKVVKQFIQFAIAIVCLSCVACECDARDPNLEGTWAFSLPDGNPVWLRVSAQANASGKEARPDVRFLWSVGSARAVGDAAWVDGQLEFSRKNVRWKPFGGKATRYVVGGFRVRFDSVDRARLKFQLTEAVEGPLPKQPQLETLILDGDRIPPPPKKPDLTRARFGDTIKLFNGENLDGWRLARDNQMNGWRAEQGVLVNETPKTDFSGYGEYGNLVTEREFRDFRLTLEYNVPKGGNSGIYLRGMYEAQVVDRDSKMQGIAGPGAIFGRIAPSRNAGREGGQWNRYVLTLVERHLTVELNGEVVIDNRLVDGCTGGGMRSNDSLPGPILLQGDHTSVRYRKLELEPFLGFDDATESVPNR
ncbi:MAG: DUF1080 domain-containing protein [Planctomycetota bacterium]